MQHTIAKLATVAAIAASMAFAQTPAAPARPRAGKLATQRQGGMQARMLRRLDLTDAQKQQARTIFQQARQNSAPVAKQLRTNREALAAAVKANDTAQIQSLSAQQGNLQGQLVGIRTDAMAKVYATLTPEQKAKAEAMREKVRERMKQRNG